MGEPRRVPRVETSVQAEVFTGDAVVNAATKNLSPGSVALTCERMLAQGASVGLHLFLVIDGVRDAFTPGVLLRGKVAWCNAADGGFAAGVRFEDPGGEARAAVERLLRSLSPS